jgi:hypothetical protein
MPWQFWRMTPRELIFQHRAFRWRQEQENYRMATMVAAMRNPHTVVMGDPKKIRRQKPITPDDVLGRTRKRKMASDPMAHKRIFDALVQKTKHWPSRAQRGPH